MSPLQIALATLAYSLTVGALILLTLRVRTLIAIFKAGQADPTRADNKNDRFKNMFCLLYTSDAADE